jgi:hypothetical protein
MAKAIALRTKGKLVCGCDLACDPDHRQQIRTIRGDIEIHHHVIAVLLEAFEREAAHAHQRADLFRACLDVNELAKPRQRDLHDPNCSRNRRSFS